jgi:16S rRNA A1518/A1519 N6-dimethyltransferase RsmA/KsgA/DIM1 with predicted DNA glycosylase/AP lyase activity
MIPPPAPLVWAAPTNPAVLPLMVEELMTDVPDSKSTPPPPVDSGVVPVVSALAVFPVMVDDAMATEAP